MFCNIFSLSHQWKTHTHSSSSNGGNSGVGGGVHEKMLQNVNNSNNNKTYTCWINKSTEIFQWMTFIVSFLMPLSIFLSVCISVCVRFVRLFTNTLTYIHVSSVPSKFTFQNLNNKISNRKSNGYVYTHLIILWRRQRHSFLFESPVLTYTAVAIYKYTLLYDKICERVWVSASWSASVSVCLASTRKRKKMYYRVTIWLQNIKWLTKHQEQIFKIIGVSFCFQWCSLSLSVRLFDYKHTQIFTFRVYLWSPRFRSRCQTEKWATATDMFVIISSNLVKYIQGLV